MINFPDTPQTDDTYSEGGKTWKFNGTAWVGVGSTTVAWGNILGKPAFGTAAYTESTAYATSAQGAKADTASQPGHTHAIDDVAGLQTALNGKATAAQGAKADTAIQKNTSDTTPVNAIRCLTQSEYDALSSKDANTLYFIK